MVETTQEEPRPLTPCCGADLAMEDGCYTCDGPTYLDEHGEPRCSRHHQPLVAIENENADPECPDCYFGTGLTLAVIS